MLFANFRDLVSAAPATPMHALGMFPLAAGWGRLRPRPLVWPNTRAPGPPWTRLPKIPKSASHPIIKISGYLGSTERSDQKRDWEALEKERRITAKGRLLTQFAYCPHHSQSSICFLSTRSVCD
ncbi:uncharacterized protein VTP21DRAFT_9928 [Calcarisporiella thermophila]|uniref:uncharacterized protein n=1 Tax=Calcarisporiella thermophila TaxID=911321 RepID=UPI0037431D3A